jgi:prophage DNA circulation protein
VTAESDAFAGASVDLANALAASANDPADAIRLLLPLAGWVPPAIPGAGALSAEARAAQDAIASNLRCAACAALGAATAVYRPISYQDAQAVRVAVCDALQAEATRAGDAGRDATYQALIALRAAVALDLAVRGANLARLVEIATRVPMPSLAEAWTLYQDTPREPGLVASADPPHPLFMPLTFPALNE